VPAEQELVDAGRYLADLGMLWASVDTATRRDIMRAVFDPIYVEMRMGRVEEYRPKAAFRAFLLGSGGNFGDPDGIRTHDLHRDRVAC
jgi:hypothetical protein